MRGQRVRNLSGTVRETTGRTSPPFKGAVRCSSSDGEVRPNLTTLCGIRPTGGRSVANCARSRSFAAGVQRDVQSCGGLCAIRPR